MIRIFTLLILISSCSSFPPGTKVTKIPVSSEIEARQIIQNKVNFVTSLFEQSIDPYYNVPKWSKFCLTSNRIGKIEETDSYIRHASYLYLKNGEPGYCPNVEHVGRNYVVYQYCKKSQEILEISFPVNEGTVVEEKELCH